MSQSQSHSLPPSPSPRHIRHPGSGGAENANARPPPLMHMPGQPHGFPSDTGRASPRLGGIVIRDSDLGDPRHVRFPSHEHEHEPNRGPSAAGAAALPAFRHGYGHGHGQGHARSASDSFTKPRLPASAHAPPQRQAPLPSSGLARRSSSASLNPVTPQPVRLPGASVTAMADPLARVLSELSADFRKLKVEEEDELLSLPRDDLAQRITHLESLAERVHEARAMSQARIRRMSSSLNSTTPPLLPPLPPAFPHRPVSQLSTFSVESAASTSISIATTATTAAVPPAAGLLAPTHPLRISYSKLEHLAESIAVEIALYRQFATDDLDTLLTSAITFNDDDNNNNAHAWSPPYGPATSLSVPTTDALHANSSSHAGDPSDPLLHNPHALAWVPMATIQSTLTQFQLGKCTCIHASWPLLAIGTSRGAVAIFTATSARSPPQLAHLLRAPARDHATPPPLAPITALSMSTSHAFLATGHQDGLVCLWSVPKQTLVKRIPGQPAGSTAYGHAQGTRITHVVFVGESNRRLITVDHLGVAFYSVVMLSLKQPLQAMFTSGVDVRRFFGSYENRLNKSQLTTVFEVARVGGTRYVALITPFKLVILDTKPVRTVYRALRVETAAPELASGTASICGALCVVGSTLFATWGNWMRVLSVEVGVSAANGAGAGGDNLSVRQVADLVLERDVVAMRQLDSKYLALVTNDSSIDLLSLTSLSVTESAPIPTPSLVGFDDLLAVSHNLGPRAQLNYTPSITSLVPPPAADGGPAAAGQLVSLGDNNTLYTATLVPAAHRLLALATAGNVPKLVHFALDWVFHECAAYAVGKTEDEAWEVVDGADDAEDKRADVVVVDLICSAALQALRATLNPADDVPQLMHLLATVPGAEPFMYAQFADAAGVLSPSTSAYDTDTRQAYTHNLSRQLLDNLVTRTLVPPAILSAVLTDLVRAGNVTEYTRLLRVVDVAQVDVDAAVRVCKAEGILSALVHLYVVMGQVEAGLESVPRDVAAGFVAEAVEGAEYREEEVGGMVGWVVGRVAGLLVRPEGKEVVEDVWGELVARCVRSIVKRSPKYRDSMVTELKRIRALQALDEDDGDVDADTEAAILDARRAFANALLVVTARDFSQDVALTSAEYFATLTQLVSAFDQPTHSSPAANASPLWPPRALVEEAIVHLMSVLTLSQDQLIDLAAQCEDRGWWRVREHMARQAGDIAHVLDCLVLDPDRAPIVFDLIATELEPLAASMVAAAASDAARWAGAASRWDMDLVAEVSQRLLALMVPLCSIDVDKCAWLVASRARPLVLAAHKALADTPFQSQFRMALAEMDPSPVAGPLLRECLLDLAKMAADGGEEAADSAALRFVTRHVQVCSMEDMEAWVEVCQAFQLVRTEALVWEAMGQPENALARLLEASTAASIPEGQALLYQSLAVALCRRIGSEELWVQLVQSLLHSTSSPPSIEPILREALLGMRDIPRILARLIHSQPRTSPLSPALLHGMLTALSAHRMKLGFSEALTRMVRHECLDQASTLFSAYRRGFYIPRTTDARHPLPCALCGTFLHLHAPAPGASNELCAWSCGHVIHSQCVRSGAATADQCPICSHDRQAQLHVAEVMGKRPAGGHRGSPGLPTGKGKGKGKARAGMVVGVDMSVSPYTSAASSPATTTGGAGPRSPWSAVASPLPSAGLTDPVVAAAGAGGGGEETIMDRVQEEERFGAPEFYRPRPPEWHAMLKGMLHQVEDEDDDY